MKLTIVVPAYNESESVPTTANNIRPVLADLRKTDQVELIFVNDGSKDNTVELLTKEFSSDPEVKIVSHDRNRGLGAAIRTGFENSTGDVVVTTDFDGTYAFNTIPQILARMAQDKVDIVTASPYHPQGQVVGVPKYRLMFSFGASMLYRILVKWNIHTWTALFRAYKKPVVKTIKFDSNDFLAGTELLVKAIQSGFTVSEFPATLSTRQFGQSSIKIARVTLAHLKFQGRILLQRLTGQKVVSTAPTRELS